MSDISDILAGLAIIISIISLAMSIWTSYKQDTQKQEEVLGFLSQFNRWNWVPQDFHQHPDTESFKQEIQKFHEVQGYVPKNMKKDVKRLGLLLAKQPLLQEEKNELMKLIDKVRKEAQSHLK